ncbi:6842_t:CDS:2 [Cetraspora pellucida]|uniref:6842_t:CDS:1 n=1 Tax=Cetraspora pellucida TaxID=1433469 RepID=A0A9N8W7U0_9GLOM|nr:6842_t:CDS:2 [Cetraspora pellucida]
MPIQWSCHVRITLQELIGSGGLKTSQFDLMKDHYDYKCLRPQTGYGYSRPQTDLPNDGTPDNKKLLSLTKHKVKNSQTREQFDQ